LLAKKIKKNSHNIEFGNKLTSFDSGIATSSSISKYTDQSNGAYFSDDVLQ